MPVLIKLIFAAIRDPVVIVTTVMSASAVGVAMDHWKWPTAMAVVAFSLFFGIALAKRKRN